MKIEKLEDYLKSEAYDDFYKLDRSVIFWVDWREEDDAIIEYCENCLKTNSLNAEIKSTQDGNELIINYKGEIYAQQIVDRDQTITFLNKIIRSEYEIRFCKVSDGADTLAFLPLTMEEWEQLNKKYGQQKIDQLFEDINQDTLLFNKEYDFDMNDDDVIFDPD